MQFDRKGRRHSVDTSSLLTQTILSSISSSSSSSTNIYNDNNTIVPDVFKFMRKVPSKSIDLTSAFSQICIDKTSNSIIGKRKTLLKPLSIVEDDNDETVNNNNNQQQQQQQTPFVSTSSSTTTTNTNINSPFSSGISTSSNTTSHLPLNEIQTDDSVFTDGYSSDDIDDDRTLNDSSQLNTNELSVFIPTTTAASTTTTTSTTTNNNNARFMFDDG
jgi:hypothetical protein